MDPYLQRPSLFNFLTFKAAAGSAASIALFIALASLPSFDRPIFILASAVLLGWSGLAAFQAMSLLAGQPEGVGRFARRHIPILHVLSTRTFYLGSLLLVLYILVFLVPHGVVDLLRYG